MKAGTTRSDRPDASSVSRDVELEVELLRPRAGAADLPDAVESIGREGPVGVLVVDDDPDMRRYVRRSLRSPEHPPFRIVEAGNGPEALRSLADEPLSLVITDVVMPGMDGFQLVAEIRRSHPAETLPILLITGEGSWRDAADQAAAVGAQAVLAKPFNARRLCEAVARLLGPRPPPALPGR